MRPIFYYIIAVAAMTVIAMFFVSQNSKHVQIGSELYELRRERDALLDQAQKLDFEKARASTHEALAAAAARLGLNLHPPGSED